MKHDTLMERRVLDSTATLQSQRTQVIRRPSDRGAAIDMRSHQMAQLTTDSGATIAQDAQLAKLVKRLVAAYSPERVFLFGSRARGEAGPDSDYDLLVVVPDS